MGGQRMNSKTFCKTIIFSFLILGGFSLWGCASLPKEVYVPLNPDVESFPVYRKLPVQAALLISEGDKNYVYKVTPSIEQLSNTVHIFLLGDALEKNSIQVFSQIFRGVQVVRTSAEAQKFKIVIAPKIEEFNFRYDEGKSSYSDVRYILFTVTMKVKTTLYREGTQIWEKGVKSPAQQKTSPYHTGFTNEDDMGEVASRALNYALKKMAEEIAQDPEVEKNAASPTSDGPNKTYARQ